ncbi:Holliday junction resolvase recu 2 [Bacillus sp. OxB-1]|uniref:Holliday junction resolvase RecU n=1 Tax=Bacillus sp. (strain OxB-1) TaxID=98228 RepID=UPI000581D31E|nr:Holliday junction resolvase RecU [Bacillus sp. OxB-1]BAQ11328.1 Holliday junction resolvase recu 2 [Bacillus sp. OxB-1]
MRKAYSRSHANRGSGLERMIDMTNQQYRNKGVADVRKVPPPVKIMGQQGNQVTGYTQKGEWVDYVGIHNGRTIIFDAKETRETTRFPLSNVSRHQYSLLESWHQKGARAFLLVYFTKRHEVYVLSFERLQEAWKGYVGDGRKSIPYTEFHLHCDQVESEKGYVLHYLKHVGVTK